MIMTVIEKTLIFSFQYRDVHFELDYSFGLAANIMLAVNTTCWRGIISTNRSIYYFLFIIMNQHYLLVKYKGQQG